MSALAILSHAHVRQPPPDDKFASAACGCRQRASVMAGGVPIVSYLVDECCDFIGGGGEGGGETYYSYSAHSTEEKSDSPSFFRL